MARCCLRVATVAFFEASRSPLLVDRPCAPMLQFWLHIPRSSWRPLLQHSVRRDHTGSATTESGWLKLGKYAWLRAVQSCRPEYPRTVATRTADCADDTDFLLTSCCASEKDPASVSIDRLRTVQFQGFTPLGGHFSTELYIHHVIAQMLSRHCPKLKQCPACSGGASCGL